MYTQNSSWHAGLSVYKSIAIPSNLQHLIKD